MHVWKCVCVCTRPHVMRNSWSIKEMDEVGRSSNTPPPRHWVYRLSSVSGIKTHIYKQGKTSVKKCVRLVIHVPKKYQIIFKKGRSFNLIFTSSFTSPGIQKLPLLAPVCSSLQSKRSSPSTIAAQKLLPVIKKRGEKYGEWKWAADYAPGALWKKFEKKKKKHSGAISLQKFHFHKKFFIIGVCT